MKSIMRPYENEDDYWRIREFLRQVFLLNGRHELSWQTYRFDYWRWHGIENEGDGCLEDDVFIWETADGHIAAVLNRESPGQAFLQVHPAHRTPELEEEMVAVAEDHLMTISARDGRKVLWVWTNEHDSMRQDILTRRGFTRRDDVAEYRHRLSLSKPIPEVPLAEGYLVRALGDVGELPARSRLSWKAFHPDLPDDQYGGWGWYRNIQRMPLYRRDLDIVAIAPDGEFASFCTAWFDDATRTGGFEPVGTHPAHRRRGLCKAAMHEGLRRLARLGATMATVGAEALDTHAVYTCVGFTEYDLSVPLEKRL